MQVICAQTAGFCMGVARALKSLDTALEEKYAGRLVMFGPIIHNPQVLERYAQKGVLCTERLDELRSGDTVVIRAHGIPSDIESRMHEMGIHIIDATCPRVKAAQNAIHTATEDKSSLLLFGEEAHPEVRGLRSYAQGPCEVFVDALRAETYPVQKDESLVLAAQTTQDGDMFDVITQTLQNRTSKLKVLHTICNATSRRQEEARRLAQEVDAMVVIGGRTSGNTRRLADIVSNVGIHTYLIETLDELPIQDIRAFKTIGVTAGASTPADIIDEVVECLKNLS